MAGFLPKLLLYVLGVPGEGVTRLDGVEFGLLRGSPGIYLSIIGVGLVVGAVCYFRTTESISVGLRLLLAALRFLAVSLVGFGLLGGLILFRVQTNSRQAVAFAIDSSGSMNISDVDGRARIAAVREALKRPAVKRLADKYKLDLYSIASEPRRAATELAGDEDGDREPSSDSASAVRAMGPSNLASGLASIQSAYASGQLRALVVLSDGRDTSGQEWTLPAAGAPVVAIPVGRSADKDLRLSRVEAPGFVYAGDSLAVTASIAHTGLADRSVSVRLSVDGKPQNESRRDLTLNRTGSSEKVVLETVLKEAGLKRLTVQVAPLEDEATPLNNEQSVYVDVRPESIRVLYVEGNPRWEYRHIKDALMVDPAVDPTFLLRVSGEEWLCQGNQLKARKSQPAKGKPDGNGEPGKEGDAADKASKAEKKAPDYIIKNPERGFPRDRLELFPFDVLILGDVARKYLEGGPLRNIYEFVKERGGGLATLGGFHVYSAGSYETSLLNQMLPVDVKDEEEDQFEDRFQAAATPVGLRHPVMQLEWESRKNTKAWKELPVLEGGNVLTRARPGASVLAVHDTEADRILLAAHKFFEGRVLSAGVDTTYRWRLGRREEDAPDYHRRFWSLLVRWLALNPHLRGDSDTLFTNVNQYHVGSPVILMTRMLDKDFNPVEDAAVEFTVEAPGGRVIRYASQASLLTPGLYSCRFVPDEVGPHQFTVRCPQPDGSESIAQLSVEVEESPAELRHPGVDETGLRRLAESTGGDVLALEDLERLPDILGEPTSIETEVRSLEAGRTWAFFALVVLLLGVEWFYRKRRGLS